MKIATLILVLLAALLLALAGCSSDPTTSSEYQELEKQLAEVTAERDALTAQVAEPWSVELPVEAAEVLDKYAEAVTAADGDAMLDYVTDGYTFLSYGDVPQSRDSYSRYVTANYGSFKLEVLGPALALGGGDTYIVAVPERVTTPALADGFSSIRLKEIDGVWLVDAHRFVGE